MCRAPYYSARGELQLQASNESFGPPLNKSHSILSIDYYREISDNWKPYIRAARISKFGLTEAQVGGGVYGLLSYGSSVFAQVLISPSATVIPRFDASAEVSKSAFGRFEGILGFRFLSFDTTKVLFICDNVIPHEHRPGDAAFTWYAFGPVDGFITQSETVQRDLLRFWPKAKFRNVPHPVYNIFGALKEKVAARAALGITAPRIILFFGYIRRYKGLHVLLDAMAALDPSLSIHLLVVGEFYDDKEKYQEQIAALGITDRVTIRSEYVSNESVGGYFSAADVVVLPYISATQSGIAQIAYNFDKPVIATAVGGLAEVVVDNVTGFLVPPEEPQALARAISRFFIEGKENVFAANVREEKKKYTWSALVSALEELATA